MSWWVDELGVSMQYLKIIKCGLWVDELVSCELIKQDIFTTKKNVLHCELMSWVSWDKMKFNLCPCELTELVSSELIFKFVFWIISLWVGELVSSLVHFILFYKITNYESEILSLMSWVSWDFKTTKNGPCDWKNTRG